MPKFWQGTVVTSAYASLLAAPNSQAELLGADGGHLQARVAEGPRTVPRCR